MIESSIYIGDLRSHVGSRRDIHLVIPGEKFSSSSARIVDDLTCDLVLENVSQGIVVHGTIQGNYAAQCSYGLVDITEPLLVTINELFEERKLRKGQKIERDEDDETYWFIGDEIDLEEIIHDAVLINLPLAPVCGHGPENCSVCSSEIVPFIAKELPPGIVGGKEDVEPKKDNRWSALDDLKLDE